MFCRCLIVTAVLSLGFAPAPFPRHGNPNRDLQAMQGEWVLVRQAIEGEFGGGGGITASVAGDCFTLRIPPVAPLRWTLRLDAGKEPKVCDLKAVSDVTKEFVGIYRIRGDTLTLCYRPSDHPKGRPTSFDALPDVSIEVFVHKQR